MARFIVYVGKRYEDRLKIEVKTKKKVGEAGLRVRGGGCFSAAVRCIQMHFLNQSYSYLR